MKKLLLIVSLSFGCLVASAQPTSFGGITPGQTTREDLLKLVKNPGDIEDKNYISGLILNQPDGMVVGANLQNDIVYEVNVQLVAYGIRQALEPALYEKYGQPKIKVGAILPVTCRNKLGATFPRYEGLEYMRWQEKDNVQGAIQRLAWGCREDIFKSYHLVHVPTVNAIEAAKLDEARKEAEAKKRKLGDAF